MPGNDPGIARKPAADGGDKPGHDDEKPGDRDMQTRREKSRLGQPLCACSGTGVFVGYASLFGRRDQSGDIVMPGAFAKSLKRRAAESIRMLFQHDPAEPVGTWLEMRETERGLYVEGRLDRNVQRGREILSLLESKGLDGLSIGFRTVSARRDRARNARLLDEIDLWEISLVTFPMLEGARVSDVKRRTFNAAESVFSPVSKMKLGASPQGDALPHPVERGTPSLAALFRDGARMFQPGET
jgi:HK97 family phage prohead protease